MKPTTLMGLDYGDRRVGVALSDPSKTVATGLTTIDRLSGPDLYATLEGIIREENVEAIVVGYPLRTDGKPGGKVADVDAFIRTLEDRFRLPVHREDESYTSQLAQASLKLRAKRRKGRKRLDKAAIDRVAACYILQDYLDGRKG